MKNDPDNTTTMTTPTRADPVPVNQAGAVALAELVKNMATNARETLTAANALAERELHDRNIVTNLSATVAVNRDLIRAIERTMQEHAQTIMQQREALDELATTYNTRHPQTPSSATDAWPIAVDSMTICTPSDNDDISSKEPGDG